MRITNKLRLNANICKPRSGVSPIRRPGLGMPNPRLAGWASSDGRSRGRTDASDIEFVTWKEERVLAGLQGEDWLIKDRLEFGGVTMLAAAPKGGKSTLVMALYAAIAKGTDFFGLQVQRVPILNIDAENRPRFRVERFDRASGYDDGDADSYYLRPRSIPDPLTEGYLERAIAAAVKKTGHAKGLVIIDTLRSAFVGGKHFNERDANSMARLLGGLRKCAERSGWAFLILHHTAKKTATFYGSVAIAGSVDYLWTLSGDERTKTSTLSVKGRGDAVEDMTFIYDLASQRLELQAVPEAGRDSATQEVLDLLGVFGWSEGEAMTTARFRDALEARASGRSSKSFAESRVRQLFSQGFLDRDGEGTRSDPHRYWLGEPGRVFVATAGESGGEAEDEIKCRSEA